MSAKEKERERERGLAQFLDKEGTSMYVATRCVLQFSFVFFGEGRDVALAE